MLFYIRAGRAACCVNRSAVQSTDKQQKSLLVQPEVSSNRPSPLMDVDNIDVLKHEWDLMHFELGKLNASDLMYLDTPISPPSATKSTSTEQKLIIEIQHNPRQVRLMAP